MPECSVESSASKGGTLFVWDTEGPPPIGDWTTVLWSGFGDGGAPDAISIPKLVEEHADALRARYLAWIYELGETHLNGKRLVDHLELRPGFSYWWMTLLVEKSYGKSDRLYDAIRFFLLEDLAQSLHTGRIILVSGDQTIAATFKKWCRRGGISFEWEQFNCFNKQISLKARTFRLLPYMLQSAVWLAKYLRQRWALRDKHNIFDAAPEMGITFIDYLAHLERSALLRGKFASNYWSGLVEIFTQTKTRVNWLHFYVPHVAVPTATQARDLIVQFNRNSAESESHSSLEAVLSASLVFAALRDYMCIVWQSFRLLNIKHHFRPAGSNLDLWPLFKNDWFDSMRGKSALWSCLVLNLFEKTLNQLPRQKLGIYLQENQGWEIALIHAWKTAGHGKLIGVPHATVRYWDLRYYYDSKCYARTGKNSLPMPDQVALNGPAAIKAYSDGGYPEGQIVEVEALRYLYLATRGGSRSQYMGSFHPLKVLVCGDILPAVNEQMMRWLELAASNLPIDTNYTIKPHPACPIEASNYPSLSLNMSNAPLAELLTDHSVIFTSNATSAAVDAYLSDIPVVQVLDGNAFNLSPLRGMKGVAYVTNPSELAVALCNAKQRECKFANPYFCIDQSLPHWRRLLGIE